MLFEIVLVFILNAVSTCLGTLKTIFLSKQIIKPVYITVFLDALIFAYAFKLIAGSSGFYYILAFALGRLSGVFMGNFLDNRMAMGLIEVTVFKHLKDGIKLADELRGCGYSVTTEKGYGLQGKDRLILNIILERRELPELQGILSEHGKLNMMIKNISKTYGKIGCKRTPEVLQ
jgi:uncharacterized protein YebE (UPF0316 family)